MKYLWISLRILLVLLLFIVSSLARPPLIDLGLQQAYNNKTELSSTWIPRAKTPEYNDGVWKNLEACGLGMESFVTGWPFAVAHAGPKAGCGLSINAVGVLLNLILITAIAQTPWVIKKYKQKNLA